MQSQITFDRLSDDELLRRLDELVAHSRRVEADLVAHIGEVERRRLYAREASPSMFAYCRERLHLSEAEAYMRIRVARAARRHPLLLDMLRDGRLHLSGIVRLLPVLTTDNGDALLARATFCSKREILELVAALSPRPDVPTRIRKLPRQPLATNPPATLHPASPASAASPAAPALVHSAGSLPPSPSTGVLLSPSPEFAPAGRGEADPQADRVAVDAAERLCPDTVAATPTTALTRLQPPLIAEACPDGALVSSPNRRTVVEPLSPGRYKVQFTASAEPHAKLERLRALIGPSSPVTTAIIDHARPTARRARLGHFDAQGRRCCERDRLEDQCAPHTTSSRRSATTACSR